MENIAKALWALSHENRLAIFEYLRKHELACSEEGEGCSVGDIAKQFDLALSTVSHHLRELKQAGLIKCVQRGQHSYCLINEEVVERLHTFFSAK